MARTKKTTKRGSTPVDTQEGVGAEPVIAPPRKKQRGEDKSEKKPHLSDEIRAGWSERQREGTSRGVVSDAESILRGEVLRLSRLVEKKDAEVTRLRASLSIERERRQENEAINDALADSHEGNRERDMSEAMRIQLQSDLLILRAKVDRLQASEAEARSERDRAFAKRVASAAQVDELRAKIRSFEASMQSGATVASIPPPLSLGEEKALIYEENARRIDRMQLGHDEVVADLRRRLERHRQRAKERGYAFWSSTRTPSQCVLDPSSFALSARHGGVAP